MRELEKEREESSGIKWKVKTKKKERMESYGYVCGGQNAREKIWGEMYG